MSTSHSNLEPSKSNAFDSNNSELSVAFDVADRIHDITKYYKRATEGLFDDAGKPNDPAPEAILGSLSFEDVRTMVLQSYILGRAALFSVIWTTIESPQKSFRQVTDHFNTKVDEAKALDPRWNEVDVPGILRSAKDSELFRGCRELLKTLERVPVMGSFKRLEPTTWSSLGAETTHWTRFEYAKLDSPTDTIRLVRMDSTSALLEAPIRVTTRTVRLQDNIPYAALSYTWGNPFGVFHSQKDRDTAPRTDIPIICDGKVLEIGENLYRFLCRWRQALGVSQQSSMPEDAQPPEEFWIDAICINQQDVEERSSQVSIMGDTYTKSAKTCVWLGEEVEFSREAIYILRTLVTQVDTESLMTREQNAPLENLGLHGTSSWKWFAVFALFQRQWFRRSWVAQKAVLSPKIIFRCGAIQLPWMFFGSAYSFLSELGLMQMICGIGMTEMQLKRLELSMLQFGSKKRAVVKRSALESSEMRFHPCKEGMERNILEIVAWIAHIKLLDPEILLRDENPLGAHDDVPIDSIENF
jgi:hypothetical protein